MAFSNRYHVPAGSFHISRKAPLMLQAFLGTCVGVALFCRESSIGGMIHLLLPEPVSMSSADHPEKYAVTGLPLLIDEMVSAGARRGSLKAVIAGGALVGPVSSRDLDLDIGGRTVEVVKRILESESIQIERSETGGFFTCSLSLDMHNGQCGIEPAGGTNSTGRTLLNKPTPSSIARTLQHLQPIPQVALKILRLIEQSGPNDDYDIKALAREARQDQVIAARTLQLANSALFGSLRTIDSLDHALVFLGQDLFVKLVVSAAVQQFFEQGDKGYSLCKGGIYHHAVGCAGAAVALALRISGTSTDHTQAYTAGLLHDIGKVVLDQYVASASPLFYREFRDAGDSFCDLEKRLLGIDHTEVGLMLAQQWDLPDSLAEVIQFHHQPGKAALRPELTTIVHLADLLLSRFNTAYELERLDTRGLPEMMARLNLDETGFAALVDSIPMAVFGTPEPTASVRVPAPSR